MPFEMPWVRRYREQIESRPGCLGAREYARKSKLLVDELQRLCERVARQTTFKQYDYSNVLGILQEHANRTVPPAALTFHNTFTSLVEELRDDIRELSPSGSQDPTRVRQIIMRSVDQYEEVHRHFNRFFDGCFGDASGHESLTGDEAALQTESIFTPDRVDPHPVLIRYAQQRRHKVFGEPTPLTGDIGTDQPLMVFLGLLLFLDRMVLDDDYQGHLSPQQLWLHLYDKILTATYTNDSEIIQYVAGAYQAALPHLSTPERLRLVTDVYYALDADGIQYFGMMPFMFNDPDISVASTAALNFAQLVPLRDGDPMTGPKLLMGLVRSYSQNDAYEEQVAAWVWGLLALGDRRILPILRGVWEILGPVGLSELTNANTKLGRATAAHVDFCLEWLEAVADDPKRAVFAAGALGVLGNRAKMTGVFDFERTLPAPIFEPPRFDPRSGTSTLGLSEPVQTNPLRVLQRWTANEYGRIVEQRLRGLTVPPPASVVVDRALDAWR